MPESVPPAIRAVFGLGNPGTEYAGTRHNVGFEVLDHFAARTGSQFALEKRWRCLAAKGPLRVHLVKPMTYMNQSGDAFEGFCHFYKLAPAECMIVLDDLALGLGRIRIRKSGSDGGHNGLFSILSRAGTQDVPRMRIGIGAVRERQGMVGHVLGKFSSMEAPVWAATLDRSADALELMVQKGIDTAMNLHNQQQPA